MNMCVTCEKSQHQIHFACVQCHLRSYMHRATDVTKLRCVRSRNVFCCSCSHCGFVARQLEYNLQTRFASVSHQSLGTAPRVSFNMRTHGWVFRPITPGGDESAIHTSETFNRCVRASTTVFFTSSSALRCRWRR